MSENRDIYNRMPSEKRYKVQLETNDEEEIIIQQIKMVLGTKNGDVLGVPSFGIDLQQFLFGFNNTPEEIKHIVNTAIGYYVKYDRSKYEVYCDVTFGRVDDGLTEYALIDIVINQKKVIGIFVSQE